MTNILRAAYTVLCCGFNLLIPYMRRHPRLARYVLALIVLNELRGAVVVWKALHLTAFRGIFI